MSAASTTAGFQQSKDNLAKAAKQLAANAWPIVDPDLPASRLRIDPARARLLPGGGGRGGVAPFGVWLETQRFPAGYAFAIGVTLFEWIGPALIRLRRFMTIAARE